MDWLSVEEIEQLRELAANSRIDFGGLPVPRLCDQAIEAISLHAALEKVGDALQAWQSSGDSRPATWTDRRLEIIRAAIAHPRPAESKRRS